MIALWKVYSQALLARDLGNFIEKIEFYSPQVKKPKYIINL